MKYKLSIGGYLGDQTIDFYLDHEKIMLIYRDSNYESIAWCKSHIIYLLENKEIIFPGQTYVLRKHNVPDKIIHDMKSRVLIDEI